MTWGLIKRISESFSILIASSFISWILIVICNLVLQNERKLKSVRNEKANKKLITKLYKQN